MLKFTPISILSSNYLWLIEHSRSREVWAVDPGDAAPLLVYLKRANKQLAGILITHTHGDHIGGIDDLLRHHSAPVFGPQHPRIPQLTHALEEGSRFALWPDVEVTTLALPGHLPEHLAYILASASDLHLMVGDVLFSCGCGRIFDGTPELLFQSLMRLRGLPDSTRVYCAHEYTLINSRFALNYEPDNRALQDKYAQAKQLTAAGKCTLPSTIASEKACNPFLRCDVPEFCKSADSVLKIQYQTPLQRFTALRSLRDSFSL